MAADEGNERTMYYVGRMYQIGEGADQNYAEALRWVDLMGRSFNVRRSKTDTGLRSIPMNDDAHDAVMELWERAKAFGGTKPQYFLFPACEHRQIAPERYQKTWRTAWRKLTKAARLQRLPVPRLPPPCHHRTCGVPSKR